MKKNKLYTVTKHNRPAFMPDINYFAGGGNARWDLLASQAYGANYGDAGYTLNDYKQSKNILGISKENNPFSKGNIGNTMTTVGKGLAVAAPRQLFDTFDPVYHLAGGRESAIGNGLSDTGVGLFKAGAQSGNGALMLAGAGAKVLGGLWNGAFGVKENKENIDYIKNNTNTARDIGQTIGAASNNNDLLSMAGGMVTDSGFAWNDLYKNGWFTRKGTRKGNKLVNAEDAAIAYQNHAFVNAANQVDRTQDDLAQSTFVYSDGGGIHIDPSKKGTFTAAASKHGMGVQEFASKVLANKEDYSPTMVKKANFARNVSKWHDYGGPLNYLDTGALGIMQNDKYLDAINHRSDVLAKNAGVQYSSYTPGTYAFGGELGTNGTDWTNGLLYVDNGGTHQQNPLGGVPVGFDQNGTPNLVEEGETIWNDYVFSNRIKVPKAMFHTLGLGGAMKKNKLTFADASKKLAKESEQRPNDPISMAGLEASLSKLAAVQEAERMKKQMKESVGLENMAAYGGPVNKFVGGGDVKNTNIPAEYQGTYQDIVDWLMENNLEASDAAIRKYAKDFYGNKSLNSNRAAAYKWLSDNTDYNQAVITKLADLMAKRPSANMSGNFSPEDAFDSLIPTRLFTEGNVEKYLKNFMDNGLSFDDAWNVVNHSTPKGDSLQQRRYNAQLQARLRDKYDKGLSSVADNVSPEEMPEEVSTNPDIEWGIQNAMQEAARRGAPQTQRGITAGNASSGTGYTGTPGVRSNGNTGVAGIGNGINLGTWRTNDNHWDKYTRPGLEAYLSRLEERYNAAETPEEKKAIASEAMNEFNNLQQSYYQNIAPGIGATTSARNNAVSEHQTMFNNMQGNYGFTNIADDINLPAGHSTGDVASQNWVDGYNGPRTWLRNFGSTEYGDNNYYQDLATRFSNMGLQYAPNQNWTYGNNTLYGLSMADEGTNEVANPYGVQTPDTPAAEGEVSKVPADAVNGEPRTTTEGGNEVTVKGNEKRPLLPTWMRYATVFGGAAGVLGDLLGLTNKPDYTYADKLEAAANAAGYAPNISAQPIGDYIRYSPFDRLFYANQLQANARATDRALANTSAPSRAAGLLANAYNTTNSLGNLYRQGEEYNLAQRQQTADFNRRTNMFNSQMGLEAAMANARYRQMAKNYQMEGLGRAAALRDSIDQRVGAARSANLTNFFNSLGNIGRENFTFNQINQDPSRSYGYTNPWQGGIGYWPKEFDSYIDNEVQRRMEEERKKSAEAQKATQPAASGAYGGKLKRNKK